MKKKIIGILILPYLVFMLLENCDYGFSSELDCKRKETRKITNVIIRNDKNNWENSEQINLIMEFESYFVNRFSVNVLNKSFALSPVINPCFENFTNEILQISITSSKDYDSNHMSGNELNDLFFDPFTNKLISNYSFEITDYSGFGYIPDFINLNNEIKPSIDSIHDLYFNIHLADGKNYYDTLTNVNLNRTIRIKY